MASTLKKSRHHFRIGDGVGGFQFLDGDFGVRFAIRLEHLARHDTLIAAGPDKEGDSYRAIRRGLRRPVAEQRQPKKCGRQQHARPKADSVHYRYSLLWHPDTKPCGDRKASWHEVKRWLSLWSTKPDQTERR
jgi:hypothetical protein